MPDTDGRYYVMPLMDAWTNVFAMVGKRTTGTEPGAFLIAGPDWRGQVPSGLTRIDAPTNMVWLIGRIQTNGKQDIPAVAELQQQFTLASLSQWQRGETSAPLVIDPKEADVSSDPYAELAAMPAREFLSSLGLLMGEQSPSAEDGHALEQLAAIGVLPGKPYWGGALGILDAYLSNLAMGITRDEIRRQLEEGRPLDNGWAVARDSIGVYGTDYGVRAGVAMIGLGALPPAEAAYPNTSVDSDGQPLDGSYRYRLRFPPGETPPVEAFWSLTMYDQEGFLVDNPIRRYAIGDRDALEFAPDGSLDLWIQHEAPQGRESNWLPAPQGPFALTMRLYSPGERFLDGSWKLPAVERIESP